MSTLNTFELIYAENYQAMFRVAYKMLGDNDGAADIVQDVCISFFHRLSNGLDVNNAKAWLNKVTYIKCMDHFRKMKRLRENELIENIAIEEEQKAIQQKAIDKYSSIKNPIFFMVKTASADEEKQIIDENKKAWERILIEMKADLEKISDPFPYPSFSVLIQDSDENLLFFEFPEENDANKFNVWVYKNGGGFVCQSSFVCDEYTLEINPSKMVFHNGCLYGLLHKINVNGVPLRLVRFKLTNNN